MGRPAIVDFASFTDTVALDGAVSILKTERNSTVAQVVDRFRKRVKVDAANEQLFVARVRAALDNLAKDGKITITGDVVAVVPGKRGRPSKAKTTEAEA